MKRLPEGESYHHVFWEKRDYKKRAERNFRNHRGLVIPLNDEVHKYLHAVVEPPPKPMPWEMLGAQAYINSRDEWEHHTPYWAMDAVMQYFVYVGANDPSQEERCHDIRWNLARQIGVMVGEHTFDNPITK